VAVHPALPAAPLIVAEGSVATPSSLQPGAHAVWLLREPDARAIPLYELLAHEIEAELRGTDVPRLGIDGIDATVGAVEELFGAVLAAGRLVLHGRLVGVDFTRLLARNLRRRSEWTRRIRRNHVAAANAQDAGVEVKPQVAGLESSDRCCLN